MNRRKITLTALFAFPILISGIGCTAAPNTTAVPTAAAQSAQFPDGIYVEGRFQWKLTTGHYEQSDTSVNGVPTKGTYVIAGDLITITEPLPDPQEGDWLCYNPPRTYSYRWAFDGKALTFTNYDDPCGQRASFFTQLPWSYSGPAK